jgi:hypothetical protein
MENDRLLRSPTAKADSLTNLFLGHSQLTLVFSVFKV